MCFFTNLSLNYVNCKTFNEHLRWHFRLNYMDKILESLKIVFSAKPHYDSVDEFARNAYHEKFKDRKRQYGTYHYYEGFEVLSPTKIKVKFQYGAGDMEYDDSFEVDIKS